MPWFGDRIRSFVAVMAAFQEVFCWFLHPCSSMNEQAFKLSALTGLSFHSYPARCLRYWNLVVAIWVAIFCPLDVAFVVTAAHPWLEQIHLVVYCSFGVNILLHFTQSFVDEVGSEHDNLGAICSHYLTTGFVWDLIATFPYYLFIAPTDVGFNTGSVCGSPDDVVHFTAAGMRLPLLLSIRHCMGYRGTLRNSRLFKGSMLVVVFFYSSHLAGCIFFASGLRSVKGIEHESWVRISGLVDFETSDLGPTTITYLENTYGLYVNSMYWAFTTLSTTGFGDILPVDNISRLVATFVIIYGLYMNASIAGHVYTMLLEADNEEDRVLKVTEELDRWLSKSESNQSSNGESTAKEFIFMYFSQLWKSDMIFDIQKSFGAILPESRRTICAQMYVDSLNTVPFIHEIEDNLFKRTMCSHVLYDFAMPGDVLCAPGINDSNFMLIISGNAAIVQDNLEDVVVRLYPSDTLNNHVLWGSVAPDVPVIAISETRTEFLYMPKSSAQALSQQFPRIFEAARLRLEKHNIGMIFESGGAAAKQEMRQVQHEMSEIASEIRSLEKMRHVPTAELDMIQRATHQMPSFCSKLAHKTIEHGRPTANLFEDSMKSALQAMQESPFLQSSSLDGFGRMIAHVIPYKDPSSGQFGADDVSVTEKPKAVAGSGSRYGAASKRWKTVVRNFLNASRFSGVER